MNSRIKFSVTGVWMAVLVSALQPVQAQRLLNPIPAPVGENRPRGFDNRTHNHVHNPAYTPYTNEVRIVHVVPAPRQPVQGYWHHGVRHGRWGWWWVVGPRWTYYEYPIYPEPPNTQVLVQQAMPTVVLPSVQTLPLPTVSNVTQNWYYCAPVKTYYPYVPTCSEPWTVVPATPPDAPR